MGRHFIIESSGASKIFTESALKCLQELNPHMSQLDQCMYGAAQDEVPIRKHSKFMPDFPLKGMGIRCDKTHSHLQLRGERTPGQQNGLGSPLSAQDVRCHPGQHHCLTLHAAGWGEKVAFGARLP